MMGKEVSLQRDSIFLATQSRKKPTWSASDTDPAWLVSPKPPYRHRLVQKWATSTRGWLSAFASVSKATRACPKSAREFCHLDQQHTILTVGSVASNTVACRKSRKQRGIHVLPVHHPCLRHSDADAVPVLWGCEGPDGYLCLNDSRLRHKPWRSDTSSGLCHKQIQGKHCVQHLQAGISAGNIVEVGPAIDRVRVSGHKMQ